MKKVVILTSRFPYPLERGDKLRIYHHIRLLADHCDIYLFSLSDKAVAKKDITQLESLCKEVHVQYVRKVDIGIALLSGIFSRLPFQVHYFLRSGIKHDYQSKIRSINPDVVYCQLLRMAEYTAGLSLPKALDYMDTFSLGMKRRIQNSPWWQRPLLNIELARLIRYERDIFPGFDAHSIISKQDKEALPLDDPSSIFTIPNGVDTEFFCPDPQGIPPEDIVFVGNLGYFPNVEASKLLALEILPGVNKAQPCSLVLAGARPATEVKLLEADQKVSLTGWLDDIRDGYRRGKVFVAPLFAGSGQQNKILEAMSMGIPCIVTKIVNEAIGGTHGENLFVAESIQEFIDLTIRLLQDEELRTQMGQRARKFVQVTYDWGSVGDQVISFLDEAQIVFSESGIISPSSES